MKLFTVGPVQMYPETLRVASQQEPYFRTPEFSAIMLEIQKEFLHSVYAPSETSFAVLTASGTGAMDAAISSCFHSSDKLLVIDGGSFGHRFTQICETYRIPYDSIALPFGTAFSPEMLCPYEDGNYTALAVNLSETSTGQAYDGMLLGDFCRRNGMYYIVDAVSAYLSDAINMTAMGIDLLLTASQKALALEPGLSLVAASKRLTEERIMKKERATYYLDLKEHLINQKRGQTPFTCAVGTVLTLSQRMDTIRKQGVEAVTEEHHQRAAYFRKYAEKLGLPIPQYQLSNSCTPILFPKGGARRVYEQLKTNYDIFLTPSGGALADRLLRVGHLGNLQFSDYDELYQRLKEVLP